MAKRERRGGASEPRRTALEVQDVPLAQTTRERYLSYALSVITSRALPDIRDGLKPVHRRILYAMWSDLHLRSDSRYVKSSAVIGEVMKSYHPHGDMPIYEALVRMAQDFSLRHPMVEGYGNFGSVDGDPPAASRYTEARLTKIAEEMLREINLGTVDFRPNYSATTTEPIVLPARVPNLLINGTTGIAVALATNIPPHNLREVGKALEKLLEEPDYPAEKLVGPRYIQGPDFPTGGVILNTPEELQKIYLNGQGTIKLRGTYEPDAEKPEVAWITSIPYGVEKDALVERIGALIEEGKVPQLVHLKDLSTDQIRVRLEVRTGSSLDAGMAYLFKNTPLQSNFHVNMTCLLPSGDAEVAVPERVDLKSMLQHFLDFRREVVKRRLNHELAQLLNRIHILEGFQIVFNNLDEAIAIIRDSDGKRDASPKLIARFGLSEIQAEAVLETKLYRLGKLEIEDILGELAEKQARAAEIRRILADEAALTGLIRDELREVIKLHGENRRTKMEAQAEVVEFREEDYIVDEDAWVIVTRGGWIKRQRTFTDVASIRLREGDTPGWILRCKARQTITLFTSRGIAYTTRANDLPMTTGHGEPIQKLFAFEDNEHVVGVIAHDPRCLPSHIEQPAPVEAHQGFLNGDLAGAVNGDGAAPPPPPYAVVLTSAGKVLRFSIASVAAISNRKGRVVARLEPSLTDDAVVGVEPSDGTESIFLVTRSARVLKFQVAEANVVAGAAKGVMAIKLDASDRVLGFILARKDRETITVKTNRGATQALKAAKFGNTGRGGKGSGVLQRGTFDAFVHDETQPIPALETIQPSSGEPGKPNGNGNGNGAHH